MFLYKCHSIFDSRGWFVDSGAPELQWEDDCNQKWLQFPIDFHHHKWRCRCDHSGSNVLEFLKFTTKTHMGFIPSREYDLRMPEKRKYMQLIFWRPQECIFCKNQLLATTKVDLFHVTSSPQKWQCRCDLSGRNVLQFLILFSNLQQKQTCALYLGENIICACPTKTTIFGTLQKYTIKPMKYTYFQPSHLLSQHEQPSHTLTCLSDSWRLSRIPQP